MNAEAVDAFLADVEQAGLELHNLMLWRDGAVVAEGFHWPYGPDRLRMTHSMTKSITACAIALLIDAGQLALDSKVAEFFPEAEVPADSPAARMTVQDLLTMRTGHAQEVSGSIWRGIATSWVTEFFRVPVVHEPGSTYVYSSAASFMLSAIVTRVTGETIDAYLQPRLFAPLGINARWDIGPDGINPGGNGISMTMADGVKFGILHAQLGMWNGQRLLPEWWVKEATVAQGAPDYGYHWVIGDGYYTALGQFVQMIIVYPEHNAVLAVHSAMDESKVLLPHLKRHFPLAFTGAAGEAADAALAARLAKWREVPALESLAGGDAARLNGSWRAVANPMGITAIDIAIDGDMLRFGFTDTQGDHAIEAPRDSWRETTSSMRAGELHHGYAMEDVPTVLGWRWLADDRIELVLHFVEATFRDTILIAAGKNGLTVDRSVNINSSARSWPQLHAVRG